MKLLENQEYVEKLYHQVSGALLEYTLCVYPQHVDRFSQLLLHLRELRVVSTQAEDYLSYKHLNGEVPCNKLLIEMLHAKRTCFWYIDTNLYTCINTYIYFYGYAHTKAPCSLIKNWGDRKMIICVGDANIWADFKWNKHCTDMIQLT